MRVSRYIALILLAAVFLCADISGAVDWKFRLNNNSSSENRAGSSGSSSNDSDVNQHAVVISYLQNKKPVVSMSHHKKYECSVCHHNRADGESFRCGGCHQAREETKLASGKTAPAALFNEKATKNIFHSLCIDCHRKKGKGPKKCDNCHKR